MTPPDGVARWLQLHTALTCKAERRQRGKVSSTTALSMGVRKAQKGSKRQAQKEMVQDPGLTGELKGQPSALTPDELGGE